ncbi:MAG: right-handed parallel beta-helix repeat-containing protein [Myxococcota bacterium]
MARRMWIAWALLASACVPQPAVETDASTAADAGGLPADSGMITMRDAGGGQPDAGAADATPSSDAGAIADAMPAPDAMAADGGALSCGADAEPSATGATHTIAPGQTLASALSAAQPGDRVLVHGGSYGAESLGQSFASDVFIEAAPAEVPIFHGLSLDSAAHLVFRGLHFDATVTLQAAHDIVFDGIDLDVGTADTSGLEVFNSHGPTHDLRVVGSRIAGGARTIFMGGRFGTDPTWNHHLVFERNELICGSHNCFQLSGARDMRIEDNDFHDPRGTAVLTAGATRIQILRNRMRGGGLQAAAIQLATPGMEWDNYAGVEFMLSTAIVVANNLIVDWDGPGIELDAVDGVQIVYNTVVGATGLHTWRRTPHDQQNNVIITGNNNVSLWNNILPSINLDPGDPHPMLESNNLIGQPSWVDQVDYAPGPGPAIDQAIVNSDTPLVDRRGRTRGPRPDHGAFEVGAPGCP